MDNIIKFPNLQAIEDSSINIERSIEFKESSIIMSNYIQTLSLSKVENDRLIELMINQINLAEKGSFEQGFVMGVKIAGEIK